MAGDSYAKENKKTARARFLKMSKSCKTRLQYLNLFMSTCERMKSVTGVSRDNLILLIEKVAKTFKSSPDKITEVYKYSKGMQINAGQMPVQENHKIAMDSLTSLAKLLNDNGIEYHIVGALPCYLKAKGELLRYHDDIDIIVDDKDIPKIIKLTKTSEQFKDFRISDKRKTSTSILEGFDENGKPICEDENPHQVLFQHKNSEFHIGFFQYDQLKDGTRQMKTYYTDKSTKKPVVYHFFSLNQKEWQQEYAETINLQDKNGKKITIPCSTVKSVYDKKIQIGQKISLIGNFWRIMLNKRKKTLLTSKNASLIACFFIFLQ